MHWWRNLIAVGILAASACPAAPIYKWTDTAGIVHYSDHPGPGAHEIQIAVDVVSSVHTPPIPAPERRGAAPIPYAPFTSDSPTREQTFFGAAGPVHLTLAPPLRAGDELRWRLNGKELTDYTDQIGFSLPDLPRGAYNLVATVTDPASGENLNSATVTFYVHRPSLLNPYHHPH